MPSPSTSSADAIAPEGESSSKPKRLSSAVWIASLWILVRLVSELDGLSWTRAFGITTVYFGAAPATFFLLVSMMMRARNLERAFRWAALLSVLGSFSLGVAGDIKLGGETYRELIYIQVGTSILVSFAIWGAAYLMRKRRN